MLPFENTDCKMFLHRISVDLNHLLVKMECCKNVRKINSYSMISAGV